MGDSINSKKYSYDWDDYEGGEKNAKTMIEEILADEELAKLNEIIIGCWGESWDNDIQPVIDGIVANKEKFANIEHLYMGDMEFDECEVSWIEQGDYSKLWEAMPQLKTITIKGSQNLELGDIKHDNLYRLEIICGGIPVDVLKSIGGAKLPELKKLSLYIGVEDYGFEGSIDDISDMLEKSDFPNLKYLGILDSEIQDEIAEVVVKSKYMSQITSLDLSCGTMTDKGGGLLLDALPTYKNIQEVDLHFHYMSDKMMKKLEALEGVEVDVSEQEEEDEYDGDIYRYPMLTE